MKCSQCGHPLGEAGLASAATPASERAVARVANLAEAGYLVSLLEAEGVAATVRPVESFNAVIGAWSMTHQISVDEGLAVKAARLLRAEADSRAETPAAVTRTAATDDRLADPVPLEEPANLIRPLTLLVVAAAVAWGLFGRNGVARNGRGGGEAEPAAALGPALRSLGLPLYAADGPNRPLHHFRYDANAGCWELASDADRDGDFETRRRFRAVAAN